MYTLLLTLERVVCSPLSMRFGAIEMTVIIVIIMQTPVYKSCSLVVGIMQVPV